MYKYHKYIYIHQNMCILNALENIYIFVKGPPDQKNWVTLKLKSIDQDILI